MGNSWYFENQRRLDDDQCIDYNCFKEKYIAPNTNFMLYFGVITAIKAYI